MKDTSLTIALIGLISFVVIMALVFIEATK